MIDLDLFGNFTSGAVFDKRRNYRYALMRNWDNSKPKVVFIGLNPSTANAYTKIVFCWGAFKQAKERAKEVIKKYPGALCLDHNADRSPKHPLYCRDNTILKPYIL